MTLDGTCRPRHPEQTAFYRYLQDYRREFQESYPYFYEKDHGRLRPVVEKWEVEQGYAYILTHPGVPTVYWKHYFDWGDGLREKVRALINARKVAGVHAGSRLHVQNNAREAGVHAAMLEGRLGELYVRVGGDDGRWEPSKSNYRDFRGYAAGEGWKVWVKLPGNPPVRTAPLNGPLEVPDYTPAEDIEVPDDWLN